MRRKEVFFCCCRFGDCDPGSPTMRLVLPSCQATWIPLRCRAFSPELKSERVVMVLRD